MAITVKHKFVSAIPDGTDVTVVRPSNWNDDHTIVGLGTIASQDYTAVNITGGTISGTTFTSDTVSNYLAFTPTSAPSYAEGDVWYDSTQHTLAYYNDVTNNLVHVGQEVQVKVINNTGSTIAIGSPVYVTSTSSGQIYPNVALAKADAQATSAVLGLTTQAITNGSIGYVTTVGIIQPCNTGTFTVGDVLYLSPYSAGQLMNTVPPTGYAVRVGIVAYSNTPNGSIYVRQSNSYVTSGQIVGTITVPQGGTGLTSLTAGYIPYGNDTSAFGSSANMTFNGTTFTLANDASISGLTVGKGGGSNNFATAVGRQALYATNTQDNAAFGWAALYSNTSGGQNSAFGSYNTLYSNTTGSYNCAFGREALQANSTGSSNTAIGYQTAYGATTGLYNVAVGQQALYSVGTVSGLTAVGYQSQYSNNGGSNNVSLGYQSLYSTVTGGSNTAIGTYALYSNTATGNTAIGYQAGYSNTTGNGLVAVGSTALYSNTTGITNNAFGQYSLTANTSGGNNSAFGHASLASNTTGGQNTAIGLQALQANTTSSNNTAVGYQSLYNSTSVSNTALGYRAGNNITTAPYNVAIGNLTLQALTTGTGYATAVGNQAGYNYNPTTTETYGSVFVGQSSGQFVTLGHDNTFIGGNSGVSVTSGSNNVILGAYGGGTAPISATGSNYIVLSDGAGNVRQTINSAGKVGINTTSPNEFLEVAGSVRVNQSSGAGGYYIVYNGTAVTTYIGIGSSVSGGGLNDTGFRNDTGNMLFSTGGSAAEKMRITSAGGVSIGTTTDAGATNLLVAGNITASGNINNTRINPRVLASTANSATPTLNTDNYDMMVITGQSVAITNFSTNLTGTPVNGQKLWIAITGTGAIAITWGTSFESSTVTLPSTTVTTARLDVGFVWNVATSKWRCVATA